MTDVLQSVREALQGRYDVDCEIGRGASAAVYLAEDTGERRQVAVKVLHAELAQALGAQRFLREIKVAASLGHPHLVPIEDSGHVGDVFYYVSPYMADGSLRTRLKRERQLSVEEAVTIARHVGEALQYVHSHGIVHRDIKPENILFSGDSACVADFGIARAVNAAIGETITSTGLVVGTPTYMSPEQASGDKSVDARSDQYSLACVVYEMLAGVPPFIGASAQAVIAQRFAHNAPPLSHYRATVPAHVEAAVARALSLTPADRYATIGAFVTALGSPVMAEHTPQSRNVAERATRRGWFVAGAAAALTVIGVLGFTDGYSRLRSLLSPALDTTRFVVLPFQGGSPSVSGADAADAFYTSLRQWNGLPMVEDLAVRDAIGARRTAITSLGEAISTAAAMGAGRLVWGRVVSAGNGMTVTAGVYDVASASAIRHTTVEAESEQELRASIPDAVDALLRLPGAQPSAPGGIGTRSYPARLAFERGEVAYARGAFGAALASFAAAASEDPEFARAHLWRALLGLFLEHPPDVWVASARIASTTPALVAREAQIAHAVLALAEGRFPDSCTAFKGAHPADSSDFAVWYGLGECRYHDSTVVPSRSSRSRWAFRSSYHTAAQSYLRAAELDPRVLNLPVYSRLQGVLKNQLRMTRSGRSAGTPQVRFVAFPEMAGDTLAYVAFPFEGGIPENAWPPSDAHQRALEHNNDRLLSFARAWVRRRASEPDALHALAAALETRGEVSEGSAERMSALMAVQRARALEVRPLQLLEMGVRQVRLHLKRGEFPEAVRLADTILASAPAREGAHAGVVHGLAALLGRTALTARLGVQGKTGSEVAGVRVVPDLAVRAAALDAYAALGACQQLRPARGRLSAAVAGHVNAERAESVLNDLQALPALWSVPCTGGGSAQWSSASATHLARAQRSYAAGDRVTALAILDTAQAERRSLRPGDISLDYTFQEAWLRAASGDTLAAMNLLDLVLQSLSTQGTMLLTRMSEAAALPRAMILRADLASAVGDQQTARRWAGAAAALWSRADAEPAADARRMQALAGW
ncbi:MAG TPA: protein kinase [Gemmatimonadaceae bacterium]|nr:protein kinase [Gemmatimonadaceae bacterium]